MKKIILLIFAISFFIIPAKAQTELPVITDLHSLLNSAKSNFKDDIANKIQDDPATGNVFYETKRTISLAQTSIIQMKSGQNMYMIFYNVTDDNIAKMPLIVDLYMDELNKMVKTGNYTGEDSKGKSGNDITDIRDKDGNLVLRYSSTTKSQKIFIYGRIIK